MSLMALSEYLILGKRSRIRGLCDRADLFVVFQNPLYFVLSVVTVVTCLVRNHA